jgi:hypothetical protein
MTTSETDKRSGIITDIAEEESIKLINPPIVLINIPIKIADKKIRCSNGRFSLTAKTLSRILIKIFFIIACFNSSSKIRF